MPERRYSDEEIAAIFRASTESPQLPAARSPDTEGLTLADLQAIGREIGISPEAVARAAQALAVRQSGVSRRLLGLPIGIERRVTLSRRLSDEEWEQLVVQLRDVFKARGHIRSEGSLRQWTNGNLYVLLEPSPAGQRLRLGSLYGGAAASIRLGLVGVASAAILALVSAFGGPVSNAVPVLLATGAFLIANGALRVPGWARVRARQMEDLATELALPANVTRSEPETLPPV